MNRDQAAPRVAAQFDSRLLRCYVRSKLATDPVYAALLERLRAHPHPLVDVGCGIGLLALYLRENGFPLPITGIDHDEEKIAVARRVASQYTNLEFVIGDARVPLPVARSVVMIDLLHYFTDEEQHQIIANAADAVPAGGVAIIRDAARDGTWRYRATYAQEAFSRMIGWLKADRLNFPRASSIIEPFRERRFDVEVVPLWGRTPFNNYLYVFRRSSSGITNE